LLIDTHCHLGDARFDPDRPAVVERARAAGVGHIVIAAESCPTAERAVELARALGLSATSGVHPHAASTWDAETAARIAAILDEPCVVAVGETGLDYHYDHSPRDAQRRAFAAQLALGARRGLPVVIHARAADEDMAAMLRDAGATLVLHSFSSGPAVLAAALERNAYVSFSGMVTFRSWIDVEAVTAVPDDRLLLETDAPALAPVPHRGRRNEPAFLRHVAERVAALRGVPSERLAVTTTANAARCFGERVLQQRSPAS
jgi:TatD DNase family protein